MDLRDEFAARAMAAILGASAEDINEEAEPDQKFPVFTALYGHLRWNHKDIPASVAKLAYQMADAMIQARGPAT